MARPVDPIEPFIRERSSGLSGPEFLSPDISFANGKGKIADSPVAGLIKKLLERPCTSLGKSVNSILIGFRGHTNRPN